MPLLTRNQALAILLFLPPSLVTAQEALRRGLEVDQALSTQREGWSQPTTGFQAGPVQLNVGAAFAAEWNDNVNASEDDPSHDFLLRPQADLQLFWPATDHARLLLGAGIGYTYYTQGNRDDRLYLSPNSLLALDLPVGSAVYTVFNQTTYSDDLAAEPGLAGGVGDYARLENTAGLRGTWNLDHWFYQAGYSYFIYHSLVDDFDYLNRGSHQLFGQAAYVFEGGAKLGLEASGSRSDYTDDSRSDFDTASIGPFIEFDINSALTVRARGGYVMYDFEITWTGITPDDVSSYYAGLNLDHRLTDRITQRLSGVREVSVGINSDYTERFNATYGLTWAIRDPLSLSSSIFYTHGREPDFFETETYDHCGFSVGAAYTIRPRLTTAVSYRFTYRDSNLDGRDYTQNAISASIGYRW